MEQVWVDLTLFEWLIFIVSIRFAQPLAWILLMKYERKRFDSHVHGPRTHIFLVKQFYATRPAYDELLLHQIELFLFSLFLWFWVRCIWTENTPENRYRMKWSIRIEIFGMASRREWILDVMCTQCVRTEGEQVSDLF